MPGTILLKVKYDVFGNSNLGKSLFAWGFKLIYVVVNLCLMFVLTVGTEASKFL